MDRTHGWTNYSRERIVNEIVAIMDKITSFHFTPLPADAFDAKPLRMYYTRKGVEKKWDLVTVPNTVAIIIRNKTRNTLVLVRQFRPVIYHATISQDPNYETASPESLLKKYPVSSAFTYELCGGTVDKSKPHIENAREEIFEECGYNVPIERIEFIMTYRSDVGVSAGMETMYYCEVSDADRVNQGGSIEDEIIDIVELTIDECRNILKQNVNNNLPPSCLLGLSWFLGHKFPHLTTI